MLLSITVRYVNLEVTNFMLKQIYFPEFNSRKALSEYAKKYVTKQMGCDFSLYTHDFQLNADAAWNMCSNKNINNSYGSRSKTQSNICCMQHTHASATISEYCLAEKR